MRRTQPGAHQFVDVAGQPIPYVTIGESVRDGIASGAIPWLQLTNIAGAIQGCRVCGVRSTNGNFTPRDIAGMKSRLTSMQGSFITALGKLQNDRNQAAGQQAAGQMVAALVNNALQGEYKNMN